MANEFKKYDLVFLKPGMYPEKDDNPINVIGWHEGPGSRRVQRHNGPGSRRVQWHNGTVNTYNQEHLILPTDEEIAKYFRKKYPEGCTVSFDNSHFEIEHTHPIRVRRDADKIFVDYYGSESYLYSNGKFATVIKKAEVTNTSEITDTSEITREQLLKMFPTGTVFEPTGDKDFYPKYIVESNWILYKHGVKNYYWFQTSNGVSPHEGYIYYNGKIAQTLKTKADTKPNKITIKEIQAKYPPGTEFEPLSRGNKNNSVVVLENWILKQHEDGDAWFVDKHNVSKHPGFVYLGREHKFAETLTNNDRMANPMSPLEIVKANFPPGTVFIPEKNAEDCNVKEYVVKEDWRLDIGSKGSIWFTSPTGFPHKGYIYGAKTGKYAKIVTPGKVPQLENEPTQVFAAIDRPIIVSKTTPKTGPNVPVIVSIPTLLKTKKKSKLISNQ